MKYSNDGSHILRIHKAIRTDEGIYTVHAVNPAGSDTSSAQLYIDDMDMLPEDSLVSEEIRSQMKSR